jgi:hypothetical protein
MRLNIILVLISACLVRALPRFGGGFRSAAHVGSTLTHAAGSTLRHDSDGIPSSGFSGYRPRPVPAPVGRAGATGNLPVSLTKSSSPPPPNLSNRVPASSYRMYTGRTTHRFYPIIIPLHHFGHSRSSSTAYPIVNRSTSLLNLHFFLSFRRQIAGVKVPWRLSTFQIRLKRRPSRSD